jgi:periplasmic mercuric ion binding protein
VNLRNSILIDRVVYAIGCRPLSFDHHITQTLKYQVMKSLQIISCIALFAVMGTTAFAQKTKTETIPVSGNCGMCKTSIEKAAKASGAKEASWDVDKKVLTVKYNSGSTNAAKIQQAVAAVGYDTRDVKATDEAYKKLHGCCQYERSADTKTASCCSDKCEMKDGKCSDMAACKDKGCCDANGVCKAGAECKHDGKADCCKKSQ